jgi:hypothetical protein
MVEEQRSFGSGAVPLRRSIQDGNVGAGFLQINLLVRLVLTKMTREIVH